VKLNKFVQPWHEFWYAPQSPVTLALFRIVFGLLVIEFSILFAPELMTWYGSQGVISQATANSFLYPYSIRLLALFPDNDKYLSGFFAVFVMAACSITLGLFSRTSAMVIFLGLASFHHRDSLNFNSGDVLLKLNAFYLMFSHCGEALSLDRLRKIWFASAPEIGPARARRPWAQRLMQLQLAAVYCHAFWSKTVGITWRSGIAIYIVLRDTEFVRFPIDFVRDNLWCCRLLSWGTLVIEFSSWTLIWIKKLRYYVLFGLLSLHLGIEYTMNLALFQWVMMANLILFIEPEDLSLLMQKIKVRLAKSYNNPVPVYFALHTDRGLRLAETFRRLDIFGRLNIVDSGEIEQLRPDSQAACKIILAHGSGWIHGLPAATRGIATIAASWITAPALLLLPQPKGGKTNEPH